MRKLLFFMCILIFCFAANAAHARDVYTLSIYYSPSDGSISAVTTSGTSPMMVKGPNIHAEDQQTVIYSISDWDGFVVQIDGASGVSESGGHAPQWKSGTTHTIYYVLNVINDADARSGASCYYLIGGSASSGVSTASAASMYQHSVDLRGTWAQNIQFNAISGITKLSKLVYKLIPIKR